MKKIVLVIILFAIILPPAVCSATGSEYKTDVPAAKSNGHEYHPRYLQKGAFVYRKNAERLSRNLRHGGYKVFIVGSVTSQKKKVYRVLAKKTLDRTVVSSVKHRTREAKSIAAEKPSFTVEKVRSHEETSSIHAANKNPEVYASAARVYHDRPSFEVSSPDISSAGPELPEGAFQISRAGDNGTSGTPQEEAPVGTRRNYEEIFGRGGSHFHPSLSVTEIYTDNAFSTKDNKKTNISTILTPEIWLSLPRNAERRLIIDDTWNRIPGGLVFTRYKTGVLRRYETNFLYRADIPLPSANSPYGNSVSHTGYGSFDYNGNKFSANVMDLFVRSFETRSLNISTQPGEIDKFYSNLFEADTYFNTGNRLRLRLDYSNFLLRYNDESNDFRDRTDNSFSGYVYYRLHPKTSTFVEYRFIDVSYDNDSSLDSREHHFLAGVQWDITARSQGMVKCGYGVKDFTNSSESVHTFIAEAQVKHQFTPRTSVTVNGFRKTDETDIDTSLYTITNQIGVRYEQILTSRITGRADLLYGNERYKDVVTTAGNGSDIENNYYQAAAGLQYEFQRWLRSSVGYIYTRRDSSVSDYDFASNTVFFRITGSL